MKLLLVVVYTLLQTVLASTANKYRLVDDILHRLGPQLSPAASITLPGSPGWDELTAWSSSPRVQPDFAVAVTVKTERDVQEVIKYANSKGLPFLAASGRHGWTKDLGGVKNGVMINLRGLNSTQVKRDGKTAVAGGGILQYEMVQSLYEEGKYGVTGVCECVSVAAPMLGSGQNALKGRYGYAADNLVSARVVLADGSAVTASASENADLFWALRGAGHNFGVVTSMEIKVYDATKRWTANEYAFTQDKLEAFFETWNRLEAEIEDPGLLAMNGAFFRNPEIDPEHPVVMLQVMYEGENLVAGYYHSAFLALEPAANRTVSNIEYKNLYRELGLNKESFICRKNINIHAAPNSYSEWPVESMRAGFDLFGEITADPTFSGSAWVLESYGRRGPLLVSPEESAVAPEERSRHLIGLNSIMWTGDEAQDRAKADSYATRIREASRPTDGVERPHSYVNYAAGDEELGEVYGWDEKRVEKLKKLKEKYDPSNRFGFYNPIKR